jgi:hypothetical protein
MEGKRREDEERIELICAVLCVLHFVDLHFTLS